MRSVQICTAGSSRHRIVVSTPRCGRGNPGSNPGGDTRPILQMQGWVLHRAHHRAHNLKLYQSWASRSSDSSAWKRTEGRTREGRGESSGKEAFIDSVAVQAISSRMKAEKVLKVFILRDL